MPRSTPITAAAAAELRRARELAGLSPRGLAVSAGLDPRVWGAWEHGRAPRLDCLEAGLDVLGLAPSSFLAGCEARAAGHPRELAELRPLVRPSPDWQHAVAQAAACLCVDGFGGGLLLYQDRWAALVRVGEQVRLDVPQGGEAELDRLRALLVAAG